MHCCYVASSLIESSLKARGNGDEDFVGEIEAFQMAPGSDLSPAAFRKGFQSDIRNRCLGILKEIADDPVEPVVEVLMAEEELPL